MQIGSVRSQGWMKKIINWSEFKRIQTKGIDLYRKMDFILIFGFLTENPQKIGSNLLWTIYSTGLRIKMLIQRSINVYQKTLFSSNDPDWHFIYVYFTELCKFDLTHFGLKQTVLRNFDVIWIKKVQCSLLRLRQIQ